MDLDEFDFDLPEERDRAPAGAPARRGAAARRAPPAARSRTARVRDLPDLLRPGDVLVFNDTQVIPAQLARRARARRRDRRRGRAHADRARSTGAAGGRLRRPAQAARGRRPHPLRRTTGASASLGTLEATVEAEGRGRAGAARLRPSTAPISTRRSPRSATPPLPPYIAARRAADERDRADYQTVYRRARRARSPRRPPACISRRSC